MTDDEQILEAARAIRPYLHELLGSEDGAEEDRELAGILVAPESEAATRIISRLERHEATADWAAAFLEHGVPPDVARVSERGFEEAPGHGEVVRARRYSCPEGDFSWYRHAVGELPPTCPTHDCVVEPTEPQT